MTIDIHPSAFVSPFADIEDSIRGSRIVVGANAFIDSFVKFKAAGGSGDIVIGAGSQINSGCVLYVGNGISIGNSVLISANCVLAPTNHRFDDANVSIQKQGFKESKGGIRIGNDVWIGALSVILDGSEIGDGCVVGSSSLVRGTLKPFGVFAGNPIKQIGTRKFE